MACVRTGPTVSTDRCRNDGVRRVGPGDGRDPLRRSGSPGQPLDQPAHGGVVLLIEIAAIALFGFAAMAWDQITTPKLRSPPERRTTESPEQTPDRSGSVVERVDRGFASSTTLQGQSGGTRGNCSTLQVTTDH